MDVIGGLTPRFDGIGGSAGKILNYYNPDDYALAIWKMDHAFKPTSPRGTGYAFAAWLNINSGAVSLIPGISDIINSLFASREVPGMDATYEYDSSTNQFYRWQWEYSAINDEEDPYWHTVGPRVQLSLGSNLYELFAFCVSSIVAPLGNVDPANISGVFSGGQDLSAFKLPDGTTKWSTKNTGHSAEFVGSYLGVKAYWDKLTKDIQ